MIIAKSQKDLEKMRAVGELIAEVRERLRAMVAPGVTTLELNAAAEKMMRDAGSIPTFIGYKPHGMVPFPYAICASVNDAIVHGFSNDKPLKEGDIVSLDLKDEVSQAVVKPVGAEGYDYTYVIMPMRV